MLSLAVPGFLTLDPRMPFLDGHTPICQNQVHIDGPDHGSETVGRVAIYTFRADWHRFSSDVRKCLIEKTGYEELTGLRGCLYPVNGCTWRFCWENGNTIGLFRSLHASPKHVANPFGDAYDLPGRHSPGWLTAVVFIGEVRDRPQQTILGVR